MRLFGIHIPLYRKGMTVLVAVPTCARGQAAELIFEYLDPKDQYKTNMYGSLKKGARGKIVSLMKYRDEAGHVSIYYGVLMKDMLFAIEESRLARA
ncbi:hypothetical protein BBG47_19990 [Paenibacillus sp. KS1]|uniref:hypothetical protein n=1 Tax=Paenibacillus sp. KS1 TaxID=1849249 RepID=UPI0008066762|nr:hypothetical protein [Paenibacillus sp. KS1]OBY77773.1 hypothetical protein BBG47_19990 [Paenibacillus sp. KS1]